MLCQKYLKKIQKIKIQKRQKSLRNNIHNYFSDKIPQKHFLKKKKMADSPQHLNDLKSNEAQTVF